jgi:hypothetical protein
MHSNGARDLVPETTSPVVGDSHWAGELVALARLQSLAGTDLFAGAICKELRADLAMAFSLSEDVVFAGNTFPWSANS